jgi:hypothetical protein
MAIAKGECFKPPLGRARIPELLTRGCGGAYLERAIFREDSECQAFTDELTPAGRHILPFTIEENQGYSFGGSAICLSHNQHRICRYSQTFATAPLPGGVAYPHRNQLI